MSSIEEIIAAAVRRLTGARAADPHDGEEILAALHAAGYAIVPREPTEAMSWKGELSLAQSTGEPDMIVIADAALCYRAMIAASDQP